MAKIEIETLTETCWEDCKEFDVEITSMVTCEDIIFQRIIQCKNVNLCRRIANEIQKEHGRSKE